MCVCLSTLHAPSIFSLYQLMSFFGACEIGAIRQFTTHTKGLDFPHTPLFHLFPLAVLYAVLCVTLPCNSVAFEANPDLLEPPPPITSPYTQLQLCQRIEAASVPSKYQQAVWISSNQQHIFSLLSFSRHQTGIYNDREPSDPSPTPLKP